MTPLETFKAALKFVKNKKLHKQMEGHIQMLENWKNAGYPMQERTGQVQALSGDCPGGEPCDVCNMENPHDNHYGTLGYHEIEDKPPGCYFYGI